MSLVFLVEVVDLGGTNVYSFVIVVHPFVLNVCRSEHLLVFHKARSVVCGDCCCFVLRKVVKVVVTELEWLVL